MVSMRAFSTRETRLVLVVSTALLCAGSARAADSILLKPKQDAAADSYVEISTDAVQKMAGPDGKEMQITSRSVYGLMQKETAKGETTEISATLDRLFGSMAFSESMKSVYDTDDPDSEEASPDHKAAFSPILNMPLKITLNAEGLATRVDGTEPIRAKLKTAGDGNFVAKSLAEEDFNDRQVMSQIGESFRALYPNRDVKTGDTWTRTINDVYPHVGKVIVRYDCTLDRIEGTSAARTAKIRYKGTITKDADDTPAKDQRLGKIDGSFTGTASFDAAQGRFTEILRDTQATIEVPPWWSKEPTAPLMKIDGQFKHRYATASAAERTKQKTEIAQRTAAAKAAREAAEAAAMAGPVDPATPENAPVAWLQWGGPNRDFRSNATGLANRWPAGGPAKLWERPLGDGFSAILCDGDAVYTMYSIREKEDPFKGSEVVTALDAKTGRTIWEHKYPAPWPKDLQMEFGPGPHSTPILVGDKLFAVGCTARLMCIDKTTGKELWFKDLLTEYKADLNSRGYGSSPLAYKETIILPVSKEKGHAVIAFSQTDGSEVWKGGDFAPGYASLLTINAEGIEQIVAFSANAVLGLDPSNGGTRWSIEHPTQWGANITTPLWNAADSLLFITSAYGMGSRGVKLEKAGSQITAKELWFNSKMKVQHADVVRDGDWVYGSSGDFGPAFLACVNAKTGTFGWRQRGVSKANVVAADGKLIVLDEDGTLYLVKADPEKYRLLGKAAGICKKTAWTVPTLYGRTLFVRDREKIAALNLGEKSDRASAG